MDLQPGETVKIVMVNDSIYQGQVLKESKDSIACDKMRFRKDDLSKVEKEALSVPKTLGLATGMAAGIVVLPYLVILLGLATGVIPFDN